VSNSPGAAIWDVDGTLVDTAELHFQAWSELIPRLGRPLTRSDFAATFGRRNPEIFRYLFDDRFSDQEMAKLAEQKEELYRSAASKGVTLLPGARQLLEGLRSAGFRQAIGSSAPRKNLELILTLTGTALFFDAIVSMEDTNRGKPDPEVYLVAASRLQMQPRYSVVFEDAPTGIQAAKEAGMKCIAVRFIGHHSESTLRSAGADLIVKSLDEVSVETVRRLLHLHQD
jgi:beta-phosphoglucomutase